MQPDQVNGDIYLKEMNVAKCPNVGPKPNMYTLDCCDRVLATDEYCALAIHPSSITVEVPSLFCFCPKISFADYCALLHSKNLR